MKTETYPTHTSVSAPTRSQDARSLAALLCATDRSAAPLVLRLALAAVVFPHGAQKLLGWFGGYGFNGTMQFFTTAMHIPAPLALGVILVEFFAPLLLALGLATRAAALSVGTVLGTAMFMAHTRHGFFMNWSGTQQGEGIEYFLLVLGIAAALILSGGGRLSADRAIHRRIAGA